MTGAAYAVIDNVSDTTSALLRNLKFVGGGSLPHLVQRCTLAGHLGLWPGLESCLPSCERQDYITNAAR